MDLWQQVSLGVVQTVTHLWQFWNEIHSFKGGRKSGVPLLGCETCLLVKAKLFLLETHLASTWHAVNGLILQRNGGISRTEIWRLKVFPLKCSNFGSSRSCPPWCLSSETTSYRKRKRKEAQQQSTQFPPHFPSIDRYAPSQVSPRNRQQHDGRTLLLYPSILARPGLRAIGCWEIRIWLQRNNCSSLLYCWGFYIHCL